MKVNLLPAKQCVLQNAIIKIKFASGITVYSTDVINKSKSARSNAMCSTECHE